MRFKQNGARGRYILICIFYGYNFRRALGYAEGFSVSIFDLRSYRDSGTPHAAHAEQKNIAGGIRPFDRLGNGAYSAVLIFRDGGKALR